jgi:small multidrug resistance pump
MAIIFEVAGTTCMKLSNGFTKAVPSILMIILYLLRGYLKITYLN